MILFITLKLNFSLFYHQNSNLFDIDRILSTLQISLLPVYVKMKSRNYCVFTGKEPVKVFIRLEGEGSLCNGEG